MDPLILAPWRNLALIYFTLILMVIAAGPGIGLILAIKGIRALKRIIRKPMLQAQMWARRIEEETDKVCDKVVSVPIGISSTAARTRVTARGVWDYVLGR